MRCGSTLALIVGCLALGSTASLSQSAKSTPSSQEPVNPQSEVRLDGPYASPLYPPGRVKADLVSNHVTLEWAAIPLERIKGYVVYWKDGDQWHRAGFATRPPFTLKVTDEMSDAQFSVATLDKAGLESKKSAPVKVSPTVEPPPANNSPQNR